MSDSSFTYGDNISAGNVSSPYNVYSIYSFDTNIKSYSSPSVPVNHISFDDYSSKYNTDEFRVLYSFLYGDLVTNPTLPTDIDVNNLGDTSGLQDIDKTNDDILLPGLAASIPDDVVGTDGAVAADVVNDAIQKKIADDAIATPIDPAVPATYPLADTVNPSIVQPVDTTYNPPTTIESEKYKVTGLQDVFPFCIPFDLVSFISALKADPVTPQATFPLHFAGILDYDLKIDLSNFDGVASIFRVCELVLTIVGLMFITKGMMGDK